MKKILVCIAIVTISLLMVLCSDIIIQLSNATTIKTSFTYPELPFTITGGHKLMLVRQLTTFFLCVTIFILRKSFLKCMFLAVLYHIFFTFFTFRLPNNFNVFLKALDFFINYLSDYYLWIILSYVYSVLLCKLIIFQYQKHYNK